MKAKKDNLSSRKTPHNMHGKSTFRHYDVRDAFDIRPAEFNLDKSVVVFCNKEKRPYVSTEVQERYAVKADAILLFGKYTNVTDDLMDSIKPWLAGHTVIVKEEKNSVAKIEEVCRKSNFIVSFGYFSDEQTDSIQTLNSVRRLVVFSETTDLMMFPYDADRLVFDDSFPRSRRSWYLQTPSRANLLQIDKVVVNDSKHQHQRLYFFRRYESVVYDWIYTEVKNAQLATADEQKKAALMSVSDDKKIAEAPSTASDDKKIAAAPLTLSDDKKVAAAPSTPSDDKKVVQLLSVTSDEKKIQKTSNEEKLGGAKKPENELATVCEMGKFLVNLKNLLVEVDGDTDETQLNSIIRMCYLPEKLNQILQQKQTPIKISTLLPQISLHSLEKANNAVAEISAEYKSSKANASSSSSSSSSSSLYDMLVPGLQTHIRAATIRNLVDARVKPILEIGSSHR